MKKKGKPRGKPFQVGYDPRRRPLTKADCQKGFFYFMKAVREGKIPSRVSSSIRKRIRARYQRPYQE